MKNRMTRLERIERRKKPGEFRTFQQDLNDDNLFWEGASGSTNQKQFTREQIDALESENPNLTIILLLWKNTPLPGEPGYKSGWSEP